MIGTDIRVSLQACAALDAELLRLRKAQREALKAVSHAQLALATCEHERATLSVHLKELKKLLYEKEHELTESTLSLKTKGALLERCSNPKQYEVLIREIDELEKKKPMLETATLDLMSKADAEEALIADNILKLDTEEKTQKNSVEQLETHLALITAALSAVQTRRDGQLHELPVAWQDMYRKLSDTLENPLVRIIENTCSGCFYAVSPNELSHIHKEYVGRCRDCYRMLFTFEHDLEVLVQKATHL